MVTDSLKKDIIESLKIQTGILHEIKSIRLIGGGSINKTFQLKTNTENYFVKYNNANLFPEMFRKEAIGLKILSDAKEINVPRIVLFEETGVYSFLILEFIESGKQDIKFWTNFGHSLGKLHKHSNSFFGLDHDNYIGSLQQSNRKHNDWVTFYIEERLEPQIILAKDDHKIESSLVKNFEKLYSVLPEIFPIEKPSLIHGDLWSGNFIINEKGMACILDPAVHYAFREMDIAMSKLFGGFSNEFYEAYNEEFPMEKGWQYRIDICNLFPLMVHVNLFGEGYIGSVKSIVKQF